MYLHPILRDDVPRAGTCSAVRFSHENRQEKLRGNVCTFSMTLDSISVCQDTLLLNCAARCYYECSPSSSRKGWNDTVSSPLEFLFPRSRRVKGYQRECVSLPERAGDITMVSNETNENHSLDAMTIMRTWKSVSAANINLIRTASRAFSYRRDI